MCTIYTTWYVHNLIGTSFNCYVPVPNLFLSFSLYRDPLATHALTPETCRFFLQNRCSQGASCLYPHDAPQEKDYAAHHSINGTTRAADLYPTAENVFENQCVYAHQDDPGVMQHELHTVIQTDSADSPRNPIKSSRTLWNCQTDAASCKYFLRGQCSRENCRFLHQTSGSEEEKKTHFTRPNADQLQRRWQWQSVEARAAASGTQMQIPQLQTRITKCAPGVPLEAFEKLQSDERTVIGMTRCVFGPGAEVQHVITNPRSLVFQTKQGIAATCESEIREKLQSFGKLVLFELVTNTTGNSTFARGSYDTMNSTLTAIEALNSVANSPFAIEFVDDIKKRKALSENVTQTRYVYLFVFYCCF